MNALASVPQQLLKAFEKVKTTVTLTSPPTYVSGTRDVTGSGASYTVNNASPVIEDTSAIQRDGAASYDALCFLPGRGLSFTPEKGWTLTAGSSTWKVIEAVRHMVDASTVAAYELRLER